MVKNPQKENTELSTGMVPVEFSVVLVAEQIDASMLNADFLRYNKIVENKLQLVEPRISTPVFSQVPFEGNIVVRAEPNRFIFEQTGQPLNVDECEIPEISKKFVEKVSHIQYKAIGINFKAFLQYNDKMNYSIASSALIEGGKWASFKDVSPDIHLKAVYNYEARVITLDIGDIKIEKNNNDVMHGLSFQANIHRNLGEEDQMLLIRKVLSILSCWRGDVSDFNNLVTRFYPKEISQ